MADELRSNSQRSKVESILSDYEDNADSWDISETLPLTILTKPQYDRRDAILTTQNRPKSGTKITIEIGSQVGNFEVRFLIPNLFP